MVQPTTLTIGQPTFRNPALTIGQAQLRGRKVSAQPIRLLARQGWNPYDVPVDSVIFAGQQTPGVAEVVGASAPRRFDERESYGFSGAYIVYHGHKLAHFTVRVRLYTEQDWSDWHAFKPLVDRVPRGRRQGSIDVTHPFLAMLGIRSAVVEDVTQPEQNDSGVWQIDIKLIEWRAPHIALAQPEGAEASPQDPPEVAELKRKTETAETLREEADRLARGETP